MRPARAAPRAEAASLAVQLPAGPTQRTCAALLAALLKHLLYTRGHIPNLYDFLLQQALAEQAAQEEEAAAASLQPGVRRPRRRRLKKSDKRRLQVGCLVP